MDQVTRRVRIGVLGAARIAPAALVKPARMLPDVKVEAVAARDRERAEHFARRHGVPRALGGYEALIDDPDIDAVYIPLPNALHAQWTLRALEAGKHVLCEKPMTSNAEEARQVADAAGRSGLVAMEAFHYRYHPLAARMREILDDGELGEVGYVATSMCFPLPSFKDIRYSFDLAGGSLMDAGCYAVHALRLLAPHADGERIEVESAHATPWARDGRIDRAMDARLTLPGGATGRVRSSLLSRRVLDLGLKVVGTHGVMKVMNYVMPNAYHRFGVSVDGRGRRREQLGQAGQVPTYRLQLQAFADAVLRGEPVLTPASDAVETMRIIDGIYRAAGLPVRG